MYLGIEIGGTKLQLGLGPGDGTLLGLWRGEVVPRHGAEGIRRQIVEAVPQLCGRKPASSARLWPASASVSAGRWMTPATPSSSRTRSMAGTTFRWPVDRRPGRVAGRAGQRRRRRRAGRSALRRGQGTVADFLHHHRLRHRRRADHRRRHSSRLRPWGGRDWSFAGAAHFSGRQKVHDSRRIGLGLGDRSGSTPAGPAAWPRSPPRSSRSWSAATGAL